MVLMLININKKGLSMDLTLSAKKFASQLVIEKTKENKLTLICFSHLRWNFVYQRPQHLISRFTKYYQVLFIEEAIFTDDRRNFLDVQEPQKNISVLVPNIFNGTTIKERNSIQQIMLEQYLEQNKLSAAILWYYTPMSLEWSKNIPTKTIVYDCMDELSAFKFAPVELKMHEAKLMERADLVFAGGVSLYHAKKTSHKSVHAFPSSVDISHFSKARQKLEDPIDQKSIPYPRLGFYGVVDERFDIKLIEQLAKYKPEWQIIIVGPVVKIDFDSLPKLANIHYLGSKTYDELPQYLSGWDVALLPFALNESTKFISPTKTPEYLAGGKPVISTPIVDVVNTYGDTEVVRIVHPGNILLFIEAVEKSLEDAKDSNRFNIKADAVLKGMSWDKTYEDMHELILSVQSKRYDIN